MACLRHSRLFGPAWERRVWEDTLEPAAPSKTARDVSSCAVGYACFETDCNALTHLTKVSVSGGSSPVVAGRSLSMFTMSLTVAERRVATLTR